MRPPIDKRLPALARYKGITDTESAGKTYIVVWGVSRGQAGLLGGSRNPAAEVGVHFGRDCSSAEDRCSPHEVN